MPVSSALLNIGRVPYMGSTDEPQKTHAASDTGHSCLDLLTDYLYDTARDDAQPGVAKSIWQQYAHSECDHDVIACVANMLRSIQSKHNTQYRIDEKRYYHSRLDRRNTADTNMDSTTRQRSLRISDVIAR